MKRETLPLDTTRPQTSARWVLGWLSRWHRRLAWLAGSAVILWGLTGVLHPLMSALSPTPRPLPPAAALPAHTAVTLPELPADRLQSLRLRMLDGAPAWRAGLLGQAEGQWFSALDGRPLPGAERREAARLARAFAGDTQAEIGSITPISRFDADYHAVNKLLPVWRVEFARADGLIAYVDVEGARLASLSDQRKRLLQPVFSSVHSWSWVSEPVRKAGISLLLGCALLAMLGGLAIYAVRWRLGTLKAGQPRLRRWHRGLGMAAGIAGVLLAGSGLIHLWFAPAPLPTRAPLPLGTPPALAHLPDGVTALTAVSIDGNGYWLVTQQEKRLQGNTSGTTPHQHHAPAAAGPLPQYVDAHGQPQPGLAERHAASLLRRHDPNAAPIRQLDLVTRFGGEYGFFQKRLPVYRIELADTRRSTWYIEPATGIAATRVDQAARLEGYVFANLHKWHWLDGLGKPVRDSLLAGAAALNVLLAALGLLLWRRRKGKTP
ncbi:hypothetical protein [Chitinilyticum litopenaei]|uniref:hypothetical protein n=1 Tax=Chitinilyticum litopenaei TaxID=1121276 RepID=UPI0004007354|nr:hypothetical protein [Chitinilyticum litopenaei]